MRLIYPKDSPKPVGPYSPALKSGNLLFLSGQIAIDPSTDEIASGIEKQATQSLENVKTLVEAGGCKMTDVMKITVFLKDLGDYAIFNTIYQTYFSEPYPAREVIGVNAIPKDSLVEISAIAQIPNI